MSFYYVLDFGSAVVKNLPASAGGASDSGSISELGRSPGGGNGIPLQYSCLKNPTWNAASCHASACLCFPISQSLLKLLKKKKILTGLPWLVNILQPLMHNIHHNSAVRIAELILKCFPLLQKLNPSSPSSVDCFLTPFDT